MSAAVDEGMRSGPNNAGDATSGRLEAVMPRVEAMMPRVPGWSGTATASTDDARGAAHSSSMCRRGGGLTIAQKAGTPVLEWSSLQGRGLLWRGLGEGDRDAAGERCS